VIESGSGMSKARSGQVNFLLEEGRPFYNRRRTAEQWMKEGKNAVKWTKLSWRRFKDNAARLHLFALA
jgi:hypothetical protein